MPLRNTKPLHVLWQPSATQRMLEGVTSGIKQAFRLIGLWSNEIKLEYLGQRRLPYWFTLTGALYPNFSLDWHIGIARTLSKVPDCLNSTALLDDLRNNPIYSHQQRYELVVVTEPLHWNNTSLRRVGGIGREGQGAIVTLHPYLHLLEPVPGESEENKKQREFAFHLFTQMITMHELGHVFGLFPGTSTPNPTDDELKAVHCQNECVMWWEVDFARLKKIKDKPFCPSCLAKLKKYFINP